MFVSVKPRIGKPGDETGGKLTGKPPKDGGGQTLDDEIDVEMGECLPPGGSIPARREAMVLNRSREDRLIPVYFTTENRRHSPKNFLLSERVKKRAGKDSSHTRTKMRNRQVRKRLLSL